MPITAAETAQIVIEKSQRACEELNDFARSVFRTRGGRIGSGMGGVIEALWGFFLNSVLRKAEITEFEVGWIYGHEYNDFACIRSMGDWDPDSRTGEILRIEAKSMVASADESKAHFDRLKQELDPAELLAVFLWDWVRVEPERPIVTPQIRDHFIGPAREIVELRDTLHERRGGTFVVDGRCPDRCRRGECRHVGEPLNAAGIRERRTGPENARGRNVSYAANFGGLLRMLGTRGAEGRLALDEVRRRSQAAGRFLDFMARNFPRVQRNLAAEAQKLSIDSPTKKSLE